MKFTRMALKAMIISACCGGTSTGLLAQETNSPYQLVSHTQCTDGSGSGCASGCDTGCDGGCDGLGTGAGFGLLGNCCLGDPWKLVDGDINGWTIGGWSNVGYHTYNTFNNFNNYADRVQLQQQWFYAEKIADGSCGLGFGGRIDYLYGTDALIPSLWSSQRPLG